MKRTVFALLLCLAFCIPLHFTAASNVIIKEAVTSEINLDYGHTPLGLTAGSTVLDLMQQVDASLVQGYLEDLVAFGPRVTGGWAVGQAGTYIYNEFNSMGLDVRYQNWSNYGYTGKNVEGTILASGPSDEIYVVCAHYDSVSGSPGADDNGSGTAAVLALAKVFSAYNFDVNIRFVCFDGEEQGLLGSYEYAEEAYNNGDNIIGTLNADMIGFALSSYDETHIKVYNDTASQWLVNFTDGVADTYSSYLDLDVLPSGYTYGSDHNSFWDFNYHALFYHEYNFNDYYHSSQDLISHMNIPYFARCTQLIAATLAELVGSFDPMPLIPDSYTLNYRTGGQVGFSLEAGVDNANRHYILLAGASGTNPGTALPGGLATLPLNMDAVTDLVLQNLNTPIFADFMGVLDVNGSASAQLDTFGPLPSSTLGIELVFAFACNNPWNYVSNPTFVEIVD
ncbi:MAG: M28 family peptidase [Planctomycetota bacterium]